MVYFEREVARKDGNWEGALNCVQEKRKDRVEEKSGW